MSLKEALLDFIDNVSLPAIFSRKVENLRELRQPLLKGIANTKRQFGSNQTRAPHRWWKLSNDVVALTVKVGGNVLMINGTEINHVPSDRFLDFLDKFTAAVDAGEFDEELRHKGAGDAKVKMPKARPVRAKLATPAASTMPIAENAPPEVPSETASPGQRSVAISKAKRGSAKPTKSTEVMAPPALKSPADAAPPKTPAPAKRGQPAPTAKSASIKAAKAVKPAEPKAPPIIEATAAEVATDMSPKVDAPARSSQRPTETNKAAASRPKAKRKSVDAKTLHARALKSAATRAANKAKAAVVVPAEDPS